MPGMDGIEFLRHLRARPRPPAVALLSSSPADVRDAVERLAVAHQLRILGALAKPASLEDVQDIISRSRQEAVPKSSLGPRDYLSTLNAYEVLGLLPHGVEVHYQPIHRLETGQVFALEALARLRHPEVGLIGPALFVPICEQSGYASQLLTQVLDTALRDLATLRSQGYEELHFAVNVSSVDLTSLTLVDEVGAALQKADVPPDRLVLELTESRALAETTLPIEILTRLRVTRVGVAADDYGTGYASLKQLRHIPFSELKIDQSFVRGAHTDERKRVMLASTVALARELGLATVAEGVETEGELELLRSIDCEYVQGFFFSKPMPFDALAAFLAG